MKCANLWHILCAALWLLGANVSQADEKHLTVAEDGSGDFKTVQEAIAAVPDQRAERTVIHLKPGVYQGQIVLPATKSNVTFAGEDAQKTLLTYALNVTEADPALDPASKYKGIGVLIFGDGFQAEKVTFQNTSGDHGQALALRIDGDQAVLRNCRLLGWQDTLRLESKRQYLADCYIEGRVDFIYGSGTAVFERCEIRSKTGGNPKSPDAGHITAANTPQDHPYGFVFMHCKLTGEGGGPADLGRPWRPYASVTYLNCEMGAHIRPEGWNNWRNPENEKTARYAEYRSSGPGAAPEKRFPWTRQLTDEEVKAITVETVLGGADHWNPKGEEASATAAGAPPAAAPAAIVADAPVVPPASGSPGPSPAAPWPGRMVKDIAYRQVEGENVLLDAFIPEGEGPFPAVILVHGGGWGSGDKQGDISPLFEPLSAAKFAWFSIDYRLAPKHLWPACFEDVQAAIRWVKAHAAEYKADPARVAIIGYSAGGQLICQALTLADEQTRVQAAVGIAPPTDLVSDTERRGGLSESLQKLLNRPKELNDEARGALKEMSPLTHVSAKLPPFLLVHGTADKSVPYEQSIHFQASLKEAGVSCELVTLNGAPHRLSEWVKFDPAYREKIVAWLQQTLGAAARKEPAGGAAKP